MRPCTAHAKEKRRSEPKAHCTDESKICKVQHLA